MRHLHIVHVQELLWRPKTMHVHILGRTIKSTLFLPIDEAWYIQVSLTTGAYRTTGW